MRITTLNKAMIMLFLLTFIGQATASSLMEYKMMAMSSAMMGIKINNGVKQVVKTNSDIDHSAMNHSDINSFDLNKNVHNEDSQSNCCQTHCNCFINGCAFTALITDFYFQQALVVSTTKFYPPLLFNYNQQSKSLYRPPILS